MFVLFKLAFLHGNKDDYYNHQIRFWFSLAYFIDVKKQQTRNLPSIKTVSGKISWIHIQLK